MPRGRGAGHRPLSVPVEDERARGGAGPAGRLGRLDRLAREREPEALHQPRDAAALFAACTAHWQAGNPAPDLAGWAAIEEPDARLRAALEELYAFYGRTESMLANVFRDEATMPTVQRMLRGFRDYLGAARETVVRGRRERGAARRRMRVAIGHALAFSTWQSLVRDEELDAKQAVELMCRLVAAAGGTG